MLLFLVPSCRSSEKERSTKSFYSHFLHQLVARIFPFAGEIRERERRKISTFIIETSDYETAMAPSFPMEIISLQISLSSDGFCVKSEEIP